MNKAEIQKRIVELDVLINNMISKGKAFSIEQLTSLDAFYSEHELLKASLREIDDKDGN